jgi:hypothetical protein
VPATVKLVVVAQQHTLPTQVRPQMAQMESAVVAVEAVPAARELLAVKQACNHLVAEVAELVFAVWAVPLARRRQPSEH